MAHYIFQIQTYSLREQDTEKPPFYTGHEAIINLENDLSSSQSSLEDVPDFLNCSFNTLQTYAAFSNHDQLIFGD